MSSARSVASSTSTLRSSGSSSTVGGGTSSNSEGLSEKALKRRGYARAVNSSTQIPNQPLAKRRKSNENSAGTACSKTAKTHPRPLTPPAQASDRAAEAASTISQASYTPTRASTPPTSRNAAAQGHPPFSGTMVSADAAKASTTATVSLEAFTAQELKVYVQAHDKLKQVLDTGNIALAGKIAALIEAESPHFSPPSPTDPTGRLFAHDPTLTSLRAMHALLVHMITDTERALTAEGALFKSCSNDGKVYMHEVTIAKEVSKYAGEFRRLMEEGGKRVVRCVEDTERRRRRTREKVTEGAALRC